MVTGRRYTSAEALTGSIVHQSVGEAEVLPAAVALAEKHAKPSRKTIADIKRSLFKETLAIMAKESRPK
jgi:enoyl-CoA hydratase/carnithine racemase